MGEFGQNGSEKQIRVKVWVMLFVHFCHIIQSSLKTQPKDGLSVSAGIF